MHLVNSAAGEVVAGETTYNGTTVRFTYRPDGLRARKEVVGGLTIDYVYDGQTVIGEKRSDGKSVWYTPGANGYISRTVVNDGTGQVVDKEWFVYDGLGSCRAMVKPNAAGDQAVITARMDYDVYGKVRTQSGSSANQFKYVAGIGHPTDEETGLIYMRARYYEPGVGRFVSEDPVREGVNWYIYAGANPVNRIDKSGLASTLLENEYATAEDAALSGQGNSAAQAILGRAKDLANFLQNRYGFLEDVIKYGFDKSGNLGIGFRDIRSGEQLFRFVYQNGQWIIKHTGSKGNFGVPHNIPYGQLQSLYDLLHALFP